MDDAPMSAERRDGWPRGRTALDDGRRTMSREEEEEDANEVARVGDDARDDGDARDDARETRETTDGLKFQIRESDAMDDDDDDDDDESEEDSEEDSNRFDVLSDDGRRRPRRAARARGDGGASGRRRRRRRRLFDGGGERRRRRRWKRDEGEDAYRDVVEKIVYCRETTPNRLEFCVKWEGVSHRRC